MELVRSFVLQRADHAAQRRTWSPDGRLIAFASKHEGGGTYQIYTVRLDGKPVSRRTSDIYDKGNPVWLVR